MEHSSALPDADGVSGRHSLCQLQLSQDHNGISPYLPVKQPVNHAAVYTCRKQKRVKSV